MIRHVKRIAKKKSVLGLFSVIAVTGTVVGIQQKAPEPVRYVLAAAARGTLVVSVTGSGQASGRNQIDVKPNVSGAVAKILVSAGEEVKAGTPLFEIERKTATRAVRDASQSVSDARLSLASAEISLQKLKQPPDPVSLVQAQNSLNQARRDLAALKAGPDALDVRQAENDLAAQLENAKLSGDGVTPQVVRNAYDDAVATVKTVAQTLEQALYDADAILGIDKANLNDAYERLLSVLDSSKLIQANAAYYGAKQSVMTLKQHADALKVSGETTTNIETALTDAQTAMDLMEPFLRSVQDVLTNTLSSASFSQSSLDALRNTIQSDRTGVSSKLSSLTSQVQAIDEAGTAYASAQLNVEKARTALEKLKQGSEADDIASAEERVSEAEAALAKIRRGADQLDIASSENAIAQRRSAIVSAENRLADAGEALDEYTIRAPFDGVVARVHINEFDQASPSTALATLLTRAKIAEVSLNEVDVAKIRTEQKVTLTFDAIPDLTIAGVVSEVDAIGTVTQGVVNYGVKVAFATEDERIKPGMSVSASIVTDMRQDALLIPNAAVRRDGDVAAVLTLNAQGQNDNQNGQGVTSETPPETRAVQTGIENDQQTEVLDGLAEGDRVVVRTIDPAAAKTATAAGTGSQSAIRIPGIGGFGGGGGTHAMGGR